MQNLLEDLKGLLRQDERLMLNGRLFKNKIIELALQLDTSLIKMLLSHKSIKEHFFQEVEDVLVFDKIKFQKFISNKSFLPYSYTSFKNRIGLIDGDQFIKENKDIVLAWPYKDCILQGGQTKEEQGAGEVFLNKTLAPDEIDRLLDPKVFTNFKRYTSKGAEKIQDVSKKDNLIIKGNNLLALHSLKPIYSNSVKLIFIDPPYNTGNDSFRYNDKFNHSSWLTFMKNRLEVARELLSNDGYILIQIDNKELAYLKILCDEVFGSSNYRNSIITKKGVKSLQKQFSKIQRLNAAVDTILLYSKSDQIKLPNLFKDLLGANSSSWNNHWRGTDRPTMRYELLGIKPNSGQWRWKKNRSYKAVKNFNELIRYIKNNEGQDITITDEVIENYYIQYLEEYGINDHSNFELVRLSKNGKPEHYIPPRTKILLSENWMDLSVAGRITKFEHEKNEDILRRIIEWLTSENDLVLDFFLGSGTTSSVAHKLKRRYIGIEQMDYGNEDAVTRLLNVVKGDKKGISKDIKWNGGGSFVYTELAKLNQQIIEHITQSNEAYLNECYEIVRNNLYNDFRINFNSIDKSEFDKLSKEGKKDFLISALDLNQLYINYSEIDDEDYKVSDLDKKLNHQLYK